MHLGKYMLQCCFVSCMILKLWFDLDFGIQKVDLGLPSYIHIKGKCYRGAWLLFGFWSCLVPMMSYNNYCRHRLTNIFMITIAKSEVARHSNITFVSSLLDQGWPSHGFVMEFACRFFCLYFLYFEGVHRESG